MYKSRGIIGNKEIIYDYCLPVFENQAVRQTDRYKCNATKYNTNTEAVQWLNREGNVGKPCKGGRA